MFNLIRIPYRMLLILALLIKEHEYVKGNKSIFLISAVMRAELERLGMQHGVDWITEEDLPTFIVSNNISHINMIIHHFERSIEEYPKISEKLFNYGVETVKISYYADGYTNNFINTTASYEMLAKYPECKAFTAYSFDSVRPDMAESLKHAKHEIVSSLLLNKVYEWGNFEKLANEWLKNFKKDNVASPPFLFLIMRPWGSESFHAGKYGLKNKEQDLFEITCDLVQRTIKYHGCRPTILYRSDSRDPSLMKKFEEILAFEAIAELDMINIDEFIPSFFTMDSFLYYFAKNISNNFTTCVFDSTTSLPLMSLGLGDAHVIGVNLELIEQLEKWPSLSEFISGKVERMRAHIERSSLKDEYSEESLAPGLFIYKKSGVFE